MKYYSTTGGETLNTGGDAFCIGGFADQVKKAFFACSTALSKSDFIPNITSDSWAPVAGLNTLPFLLDSPETILPLMYCCS